MAWLLLIHMAPAVSGPPAQPKPAVAVEATRS